LYRSLGSISANLAEGYSRGTGKDRARFYEYALGSARESRDWYFKARHILGDTIAQHRMQLLSEIIRLVLTMIPQQRSYSMVQEEWAHYGTSQTEAHLEDTTSLGKEAENLLQNVPLPDSS
jgi:hypothetical protein